MVSADQILERVNSYLAGGLSLDEFEDWIAVNTWNVHQWGSDLTQYLSYSIELALSEHSSGHLPEPQMKLDLRNMISWYSNRLAEKVYRLPDGKFQVPSMGASNSNPRPVYRLAVQELSAGTLFAGVSS